MTSYRGAHRSSTSIAARLDVTSHRSLRRGSVVAGVAVLALGLSGAVASGATPLTAADRAPADVTFDVAAEDQAKEALLAQALQEIHVGTAAAGKAADARIAAAKASAEKAAAAKAAAALAAAQADPQSTARQLLAQHGWGEGEFACLSNLWNRESNWRFDATNPSSGAYGIPQSLPAEKMASAGADWRTNPTTQISWGLGYIKATYGSPCGAWAKSQSSGWY